MIGVLYSFVYGILLFVCFFVYNVIDGTLDITLVDEFDIRMNDEVIC